MTETERDVREMLRRRAADVTAPPDRLDEILAAAAAPPRRAVRAPMLAVAALVAVALLSVGLALSQSRDDETAVEVASGDDTSATTDPPAAMTTTTMPSQYATAGPAGVWPWPGDFYDEAALLDPVETAKAYVQSTVGMSQGTTVSAFRPVGDFGYVDFGGDLRSTVAVARIGDRWHVESASSDLISAHANADGSITLVAEQDGETVEWIGSARDTQGDSSEGRPVKAGDELWRLEPSAEPLRARFLLSIDEPAPNSEFNVAGLAEMRAPQATFP